MMDKEGMLRIPCRTHRKEKRRNFCMFHRVYKKTWLTPDGSARERTIICSGSSCLIKKRVAFMYTKMVPAAKRAWKEKLIVNRGDPIPKLFCIDYTLARELWGWITDSTDECYRSFYKEFQRVFCVFSSSGGSSEGINALGQEEKITTLRSSV